MTSIDIIDLLSDNIIEENNSSPVFSDVDYVVGSWWVMTTRLWQKK